VRIGVFGGTFDPPHLGHLIVAERAREQLSLERVIFVPSNITPHKRAQSVGSARERAHLTKLALRRNCNFELSTHEIDRSDVSYTVDTLEFFHKRYPDTALYFLLGEDNLRGFRSWKSPDRILELATLAVYRRGKPIDKRTCRGMLHRIEWLSGEQIPISSSDLRQRVSTGKSIRFLTPDAVRRYILEHSLYAAIR
jgi:nicotinate-nucleotide adenylyltransferase